jgi:hypothetical protein
MGCVYDDTNVKCLLWDGSANNDGGGISTSIMSFGAQISSVHPSTCYKFNFARVQKKLPWPRLESVPDLWSVIFNPSHLFQHIHTPSNIIREKKFQ